jgi:hypothetical protein
MAYARGAAAVEQSTWAGGNWGESSAASSLAHIDCSDSAVRSLSQPGPSSGRHNCSRNLSLQLRPHRAVQHPSTCKPAPCCVQRWSEEGLIDEFGYEEATKILLDARERRHAGRSTAECSLP